MGSGMPAPAPYGLTVGYVTSTAWSSRLIEWRSAGGPSHATTLVEPGWVIDARLSGGVQRRPVAYLAGQHVQWLRVPATRAQVQACIKALASQIGRPYDWRDIFSFAVPATFRRDWRAGSSWICSELQAWAEEKGGVCPPLIVPANRLAPNDVLLVNSARGAVPLPGPVFA